MRDDALTRALLSNRESCAAFRAAQHVLDLNPEHTGSLEWAISGRAVRTLYEWRTPPSGLAAALLVPPLQLGLTTADYLSHVCGERPTTLASRFVSWRTRLLSVQTSGPELSHVQRSLLLRQLYREAYLDGPELLFVRLLLAGLGALFSAMPTIPPQWAPQIEHVLVPFSEMLGVWELRRKWIELSVSVSYQETYAEMKQLLGSTELYTNKEMQGLASSSPEPRNDTANKLLRIKATAYTSIHKTITERALLAGIRPLPRLSPLPALPGLSVLRHRDGASKEELTSRLDIRIFCRSIPDCYRLLGIVHSLGTPVLPRFRDFIAVPEPNGYRALHTALIYGTRTPPHTELLAEFRILTVSMQRRNNWGALQSTTPKRSQVAEPPGDLSSADTLPTRKTSFLQLLEALSRGPVSGRFREILTLLKDAEVDAAGPPKRSIYVFTPRGELVLLSSGSTALDFAYHIHTQLGHRASKIEVNGQISPHQSELRNGDLIRVRHDADFKGPDLAWLGFLNNKRARSAVRRELRARAQAIHVGRLQVDDTLLKTMDYYGGVKRYELRVTTRALDSFLLSMASELQLANPELLYEDVASGRLSPHKIVDRFLSRYFSGALLQDDGQQPPHPQHRISVCSLCRPVPGEDIVGFVRRSGRSGRFLVVHAERHRHTGLLPGTPIKLRWSERTLEQVPELAVFVLSAMDRYGLLRDVLEIAYRQPHADLRAVDARTASDGSAEIVLSIELKTMSEASLLQHNFQQVPSVRQVRLFPPTPSERAALQQRRERHYANPYFEVEVYDRHRFFDRDAETKAVLDWLLAQDGNGSLILHGQHRVGKTSLAKYLTHEILPAHSLSVPVYVDLHALSNHSPRGLVSFLTNAICRALEHRAPAYRQDVEPTLWFDDKVLSASAQHLGPRHLLLILDEFNVLLDAEHRGLLDPTTFMNLRSLVNRRRDTRWIFVIQDSHFKDPGRWGTATLLFQQAHCVSLENFTEQWALKLALEPMRQHGLEFEDRGLPDKIVTLTAGNTYLIKAVCFYLFEAVRQTSRTQITAADLNAALRTILADGFRYFAHFLQQLDGLRKVLAVGLATLSPDGTAIDANALIRNVRARNSALRESALRRTLDTLERLGIVIMLGSPPAARLSVPLFQMWLAHEVKLDDAIDEWCRSSPGS